jgi:hypothetical protein
MRSASLLNFLARRLGGGYDRIPRSARRGPPPASAPRTGAPPARRGTCRRTRAIRSPAPPVTPARLARRVPPLMDRFAGFGAQIAAATRGQRYEIAVIEHFWCAPYWEQAAAVSDATILDLHNIESVWHARCAQAERGAPALAHRAFQRISRNLEEEWLPRFTYLLAASEPDRVLLRTISPSSHVLVYPNSIPLAPAPPRRKENEENVIVFLRQSRVPSEYLGGALLPE